MPVYYDITDILDYARKHTTVSGIQRVSFNVLSRLVTKHGADEVRVSAYHPRLRRWLWYDASFFAGDYAYDRDCFVHYFGLDLPFFAWLRQRGMPPRGRTSSERGLDKHRGKRMQPGPGDVIVVPGATWGLHRHRELLVAAKRRHGARVFQFIHDLIPLNASEHVVPGTKDMFASWLDDLSGFVDGFIANSEATKADLDAWLACNKQAAPTRVVPLAHQFGLQQRGIPESVADETVGTAVRAATASPFVVHVGTREPRKNLLALAKAWQLIQETLGPDTPRLIIAGSRGWLHEEFDAFIAETKSLGGRIVIIERPSDRDLAYLYRRCMFTVFVSVKEGWGLPIGEGLWFGRPVVCSNTSSMPEVGRHLADYVDPLSTRSIAEAAMRLIVDREYREARAATIARAELRTWQDVADDLWAALKRG